MSTSSLLNIGIGIGIGPQTVYAETGDAPMKLVGEMIKGEGNNKILDIGIANPIQPILDKINTIEAWIKDIPHNIAEWSIELMADLYELASSLILKTPLWIFDNQWFHNTTFQFSLISISIVSILTTVEGIKQMFSKVNRKVRPMELKDILKRWFCVSGVLTAVPWLFQKAFQILNWVSDILIKMGGDTMRTVSVPENIPLFDVFVLLLFDIILIATVIPVLWKNGRRFFDIMVLGMSTPFALTAWIFDNYRHLHKQWWDSLKHLSLVQVFYALFLLVLGLFMFGVPTPTDFTGMIIKILVVIGGFARLIEPPRLISKHLDNGGGFDEVTKGIKKTVEGTKKNWKITKDLVAGPKKFLNKGKNKK